MTDMNRFKMPMIMSPQDAADKIIAGLNSNRFEIYFPTFVRGYYEIFAYSFIQNKAISNKKNN